MKGKLHIHDRLKEASAPSKEGRQLEEEVILLEESLEGALTVSRHTI